MRASGWLAAVAFALGGVAAVAGPGEIATGASAERLQALIAGLGSGQFREREAASRELNALGEAALDALRQAVRSADPETRRRAADLVERINTRLATARILAPTLVALNYRNTPLAEAVDDLAKRTGAPIKLVDAARNRGRTVTVVTDPMPFWQALEQFCRKADLHEWDGPLPTAAGQTGPARPEQVIRRPGQPQIVIRDAGSAAAAYANQPITLLDGPAPDLPANRAGAVRVRALPPGTPFPVSNLGADEFVLPLHVSAEPRLNCQGPLDVWVHKAVDDQGRSLSASAVRSASASDVEEWLMMPNGQIVPSSALFRAGPVGVRLRRGGHSVKALSELAGSVTAQVRAPEVMATVTKPATAALDKTIQGEHGVTVKLVAWFAGAEEVRVAVRVEMPIDIWLVGATGDPFAARFNQAAMVQAAMIAQLQRQNGVILNPIAVGATGRTNTEPTAVGPGSTDYHGLSLEDAQGRRLEVVKASPLHSPELTARSSVHLITATFRCEKGTEPARLVFTATRAAVVDVPFVLKDVPLQ